MDQPSVNHKSFVLTDSSNALKEVLTSCIIYSAQYYPYANSMSIQAVTKHIGTHQEILLQLFAQLIDDLNRQIVYGPNADYIGIADRPHHQHLNSTFTHKNNENMLRIEQIIQSISPQSIIYQIVGKDDLEELLWYRRSNYMSLSAFIHKKVGLQILKQLQVNGQSWTKVTPLPTLFLIVKECLRQILQIKSCKINPEFNLLFARISFMHNKILENPAKNLADCVLTNYRKYIQIINKSEKKDPTSYVSILLEYTNALLFYYKYSECERIIDYCKQITNLELEFTGRLGRRTKYQSFDTPQLVMNMKNKSQVSETQPKYTMNDDQVDTNAIQIPNAKQLVLKQIEISNKSPEAQIETAKFDEENILLEKPKFIEDQQQSKEVSKMPIEKILVALSAINYMYYTSPKQQILFQYVSTSINTLLQHKQCLTYPIMFSLLLLRSLNQFPRLKNVQRALQQLQKLKDNFNNKVDKNMQLFYATSFSPFSELIKTVAQKYMQIGMTMTAIQLFEKVGMIQQCIDGLISKQFKQKALALATKFEKQNGKTPRLLCMLGDLEEGDKSVKYYQQAWRLSQMRNARSQRSLGWHYFRKKQYARAAECFKRATQANFYHPNTWFTLGCCYMQLKEFQKAVSAFGECVCIDQTQGQAWGNIASCYIHQNRYKQAFSTLQQALKYSEKSWKMWSNMLSVSLKLKKFYKYFQCVEKLAELQKYEIINPEILSKLITIFQYQQDNSDRRRLIQAMKNRLDRLYKMLIQKMGQNPIVWHSIYQYNIQLQNFTMSNYKYYKKRHSENLIDKNDLLEGYENQEEMQKFVNEMLHEIRDNIVSSKQTELNMTMKIGWQSNKIIGEAVLKVLKEYIQTFEKYNIKKDEQNLNEYHLFINGVRQKLENCLQRKIQLKIK